MKITEKKSKSIISDSNLYEVDYSINPYTGCSHGCKYCYATYMKKFTEHKEPWGKFVEAKTNAPELLEKEIRKKKKGKILLSSVTDPYQPIEKQKKITRKLIEKLKDTYFSTTILTKSSLIKRDKELFQDYLGDLSIGLTINSTKEKDREIWEPNASPIQERIQTLKELNEADVKTYIHVGPYLPEITDLRQITKETAPFVDKIEIENLNTKNKETIRKVIEKNYPTKIDKYKKILNGRDEATKKELIQKTKKLKEITDTEITLYLD